jgi:hypothetical protein
VDNLINVVGESILQITIVEDISAGTKYYEEHTPRGNNEKISKIDLTKEDLNVHT